METGATRQINDLMAEIAAAPGKYRGDDVIAFALRIVGAYTATKAHPGTFSISNGINKSLATDRLSQIDYVAASSEQTEHRVFVQGGPFDFGNANTPFPAELFDEIIRDYREGNKTAREFIDIFVDRLTKIDFDMRCELALHVNPYNFTAHSSQKMVSDISTFQEQFRQMPKQFAFLDFGKLTGLVLRQPVSAVIVKRILQELFQCHVDLIENRISYLTIPEEVRCCLSNDKRPILGKNSLLGRFKTSATGRLDINITNLKCEALDELVVDPVFCENLRVLFRAIYAKPLNVQIMFEKQHGKGAMLGINSTLGCNSWLESPSASYEPALLKFNSWD